MGTGIIYAAIVVAWAAYLLPLVRHHRAETSATRPDRATGGMRVLGKRTSGARAHRSDRDEPVAPVADGSVEPDVPARVEIARPRYDAAARRRRVLVLILATAVVIAVFAYVGMVPWWSLAAPGVLLVGFVVLARLSVRATRSARRRARARTLTTSQHPDMTVALDPVPATVAAVTPALMATASTTPAVLTPDPAAVWVAHSPVDAWDPLPVTLPTYVTKDAAPARRVRTIDLSGAAAFSAGRLPEAALLSRQPESVEELTTGTGRPHDGDTARAATG